MVRDFGPLSTGARILPVAISIAIASVVGGILAPRVGTRAVVVTGLLSFGTAMAWIAASVEVDTSYWATIVPQMVLMGLGMGLISTPATESIMLVLPPARAGVGSAVNDATRELGATLGVAVIGSVFSSVFGARLLDSAFSATGQAETAADSVPLAVAMAGADPALLAAVQDSFLSGLSVGCTVVAGLCFAAAVAGLAALPGRRFHAAKAAEARGSGSRDRPQPFLRLRNATIASRASSEPKRRALSATISSAPASIRSRSGPASRAFVSRSPCAAPVVS